MADTMAARARGVEPFHQILEAALDQLQRAQKEGMGGSFACIRLFDHAF